VAIKRANGSPVRHYLGYTKDPNVSRRLEEHKRNRHSSAVVQAFLRAGGQLQIGRVWYEFGPEDERRLKRNGHIAQHCLLCAIARLEDKLPRGDW
jgi:predicted GIY-YIG superfamily endonuclease